ncbi:tRNA (adenosine(37)-N6)-threonylcarbamoyltransferase complex dimerization subunit type 1 TsaB [Cellulosimicrobium marinum]|uniref:tRNA (adenosine(37)-N6)-threonylcarbamoyltransferase complex dimerization subunit type 1 TsaB n=1 Tax=Cellulosimicrobium marinum TaxID=1638992 RepID=UPI001E441220|nr:tRNA (adenosine(37)-N6)-threonylcarbamoyltransferase complex dimerization subunit type 1 TsaB [Cellulosimicrobium marinum]MCB7136729.1 tRNA (adenosine(37)-N6)-threonylcarbamoyltransferase complex dimerization subunit type 1 TsaB [Cellulosimicrobium marinum]
MPVLALDTSASVTVAVVGDDGARLARREVPERRRHAEALAPLVEEALAEAGVARSALTAVVVGTGPAPFTGLRVGLVTARALGYALGVPVLGVPSLDAVAVQAVSDLGLVPDDEVLVATDARRREVYWARYRVVAHEGPHGVPVVATVAGPDVAAAAAVAEHAAGAVVVGEGASLYADVLGVAEDAPLVPDAAVLARIALARRDAGQDQPTEPLYLRRPDVQEPAGAKRVSDAPAARGAS